MGSWRLPTGAELQAGRMDKQIVIQEPTDSQGDDYGDLQQSWGTFATVYANVYEGPGREIDEARQINAEITTQFHIRYLSGLSPKMRIYYNSRYYEIFSIREIGRQSRVNIFAKARYE